MSNEKTADGKPASLKQRLTGSGSGRKRKTLIAVSAVAVVLGAIFGYPAYRHMMTHESTEDAFVEAQVISISPRVAGHVARVLVSDNQWVEEGQLLAEVDPRDFKVTLGIAEANLASAKAALEEAEAKVRTARNNLEQKGAGLSSYYAELAQARAGVAEVEAGFDRDESDLKRMRKIADAGAVSRQEYDHAKAQADMSKAKLNSARKQVDTQAARISQAKASVSASENELLQAFALVDIRTAELHQAEAEVERARLNLSYTRVTAPKAGFITKKAVEPGAYVQVGQKFFSIVGSDVWVVANFKETQIADMRPGQPVEVEVDAYPGVTFAGRVDSIQRGTGSRFTLLPPENATGNFIKVVQRVPVKIVFGEEGRDGFLLAPGMSVVPSVNVAAGPADPSLQARLERAPKTQVQ